MKKSLLKVQNALWYVSGCVIIILIGVMIGQFFKEGSDAEVAQATSAVIEAHTYTPLTLEEASDICKSYITEVRGQMRDYEIIEISDISTVELNEKLHAQIFNIKGSDQKVESLYVERVMPMCDLRYGTTLYGCRIIRMCNTLGQSAIEDYRVSDINHDGFYELIYLFVDETLGKLPVVASIDRDGIRCGVVDFDVFFNMMKAD